MRDHGRDGLTGLRRRPRRLRSGAPRCGGTCCRQVLARNPRPRLPCRRQRQRGIRAAPRRCGRVLARRVVERASPIDRVPARRVPESASPAKCSLQRRACCRRCPPSRASWSATTGRSLSMHRPRRRRGHIDWNRRTARGRPAPTGSCIRCSQRLPPGTAKSRRRSTRARVRLTLSVCRRRPPAPSHLLVPKPRATAARGPSRGTRVH